MKCEIVTISTVALVLGLATGIASAQSSTSSVPLADLARQLKAQRAKSGEKSKVYTNEDIAGLSPSPEPSTASPAKPATTTEEAKPEEKPAKATSGNEAEKKPAEATGVKTGEETHGEEYFRNRMSKLQNQLDTHQRELVVLQQKLGQNEMMYYPDPNKGLLQQSGPTAMADVYKLQDQIAKKKAEIAADQEAIEDLREQLRREGGDAGWLR
jgi:hypothetical protein